MRQPGKHVRRRQTEFQSTHPVWGATKPLTLLVLAQLISIHAPRVGCDQGLAAVSVLGLISIHAPRVGCDLEISSCSTSPWRFQSTHPVWGATRIRLSSGLDDVISIHAPRVGCDAAMCIYSLIPSIDFNPRTPCGVRHPDFVEPGATGRISIHAPRVGCDTGFPACVGKTGEFQSTHPVWGATAMGSPPAQKW